MHYLKHGSIHLNKCLVSEQFNDAGSIGAASGHSEKLQVRRFSARYREVEQCSSGSSAGAANLVNR
jgi:hypothetical protein